MNIEQLIMNYMQKKFRTTDLSNFDSLDQTDLMMDLEDLFNIVITDEEQDSIKSLHDVISLVERKTKNA